jgi:hypothetical protein
MSADSFVVYYGVRRRVTGDGIEQCEARTHPWMRAARDAGLKHYWGNFSIEGAEDYLLFVGRQLGVFGAEGIAELRIPDSEFQSISGDTRQRLERAGILETPALHIQYGAGFLTD